MPAISIKAIFLLHWFLTMWALLAWPVGSSYVWCNISVLVIAVWAIADRQSVDAILLYLIMLVCSCVIDIVCLSLYFNDKTSGSAKFSQGMAILNLIFKPFSAVLLFQMYRDRGGEYNISFGQTTPSYENLSGDEGQRQADGHGSTAYIHPKISTAA